MILIIDNGSQYTHLIKRNMRDLGRDAEIANMGEIGLAEAVAKDPEAVILSGGPSSVYAGKNGVGAEIVKAAMEGWDVPLLGVCYGHQLIAYILGGEVAKGGSAEYGLGRVVVDKEDLLFKGVPKEFQAWVSHFDEVKKLPEGFEALAHSSICKVEAMRHRERRIFGTQFHPEVWHTEHGERILQNFLSCI